MPKIHLAWFGNTSPKRWNGPTGSLYDLRQPAIFQDVARLCERAKFDLLLLADTMAIPTVAGSNAWYVQHGAVDFDPVPAVTMMAAATSHIGVAATLSTTFYPPYLLARLTATLDHMTGGRLGWNVVTSASTGAALNFGLDALPPHDERYDIAEEYLELCKKLWSSWASDAVTMDRPTGVFADANKVRPVFHEGRYFKSRGPLTVTPSPQGGPVLLMAGTSPRGQVLTARHAEMAIAHKNSLADMRSYVGSVREGLEREGRDPQSTKVFFSIKPVLGETETLARQRWDRAFATADVDEGLATISNYLDVDLSAYELDQPLPSDMKINGIVGSMQRYRTLGPGATLRDWARNEAMHETFPLCGTPERVADMMEETVAETGCDGFHFRPDGFTDYPYLVEIATRLVPVLQARGLARREYTGTTLRDHLFEF